MDKKTEYIVKYNKEHYRRIALGIRYKDYDRLKDAAEAAGEKVTTYIKNAINRRIESGK